MNVQKIDTNHSSNSKIKQNIKIAGASTFCGSAIAILNLAIGKVTPNDIFQYKNIPLDKKNLVKTSVIGGVITAALLTLQGIMNTKKSGEENK